MDARIFGLTTLTAVMTFAAPAKMEHVDFRAPLSIGVIEINKSSPAYAALEAVQTKYIETAEVEVFDEVRPEKLVRISFHKKNLRQQDDVATAKTSQIPKIEIVKEQSQDHLAKLVRQYTEEPPAPSAVEVAEVLVREELSRRPIQYLNSSEQKAPTENFVRQIPTEGGGGIIISKPVVINTDKILGGSSRDDNKNVKADNNSGGREKRESKNPIREIAANPPQSSSPGLGALSALGSGGMKNKAKPTRYIISGPLTFLDGAAFLGQKSIISVEQIVDGIPIAVGLVNISEAFYEIEVEDIEGELLAELRNQDGQIMGVGRVNLYDHAAALTKTAMIKDFALNVRPVFNGTRGTVISAASYDKHKYEITDARLQIMDLSREIIRNKKTAMYEDDSLSMPSFYILKGTHRNFWPSLSFAESGEDFQLRLFPNGLVEALLNITLDKYAAREARDEGIIWGRVSMLGRTVEGAKIHVVGEKDKPVTYFNGLLPDKARLNTGSKGEFAVTRLMESETLLRISINNKFYMPTLLPTANEHITYADLELEQTKTVEFKSYHAFSGAPEPAYVQPLGTQEQFFVPESGAARFQLDTVKGLTLLESSASEKYLVTRATLKTGQTEVHLPQIPVEWLENIKQTVKKSMPAATLTTATVGFVMGDNYDVVLGGGSAVQNLQIVYFDSEGNITKNQGVGGGGFVVMGLPRGLHTLTIIPEKSKKVVSLTAYVDEYAVQVIRANLML